MPSYDESTRVLRLERVVVGASDRGRARENARYLGDAGDRLEGVLAGGPPPTRSGGHPIDEL